jgi:translin
MKTLESIVEAIREEWTQQDQVRDLTLQRSRLLIRHSANSIRATHRRDYAQARALLQEAAQAAEIMQAEAAPFGDIASAGYLLDALKEYAEAALVLAFVTENDLPDPASLGMPNAPYLNGMGEAAGELRRFALDAMRRDDLEQAERVLGIMDEIYSHLVTMDFPDTLTRGLRRTTDMVRGVTERTRGDLTVAVRQDRLQAALRSFETRLGQRASDDAEA